MPANLSPEYKKAEQAFRAAHEARERLVCLREMLRTIPKHKGTEHIQADIKSRMRQLTDELNTPHKGPTRSGAAHVLRHEGAAQICMIGPPNSGKSSLHAILTGSKAEIGPFPYTTREPLPGMLPFEGIAFQLIDLPPISAQHNEPWIAELLQSADAAWLVIDLADPACAEHLLSIGAQLAQRRITLHDHWPGLGVGPDVVPSSHAKVLDVPRADDVPDPFHVHLPTLLVANKSDLGADSEGVDALEELTGTRFPAVACSARTGCGLDHLAPFLFESLQIMRVYTKPPGQPPDRSRPFAVRRGDTVLDVARLVHQDVANRLKFARLWGSGAFDGQQVGPDHLVADGDVVELHEK
ncbi:MAG: TGS domain-containing protein [Steroidobacteraceae bacterium]